MPILNHISGEQLRMPSRVDAGGPFRQVAKVAEIVQVQQERTALAERQNRIDDATINTKKQLAVAQAGYLKDPLATKEEDYIEQMSGIVSDNSGGLENEGDRYAFSRDMSLSTTLLGINAKAARTQATAVKGRENAYTKLKGIQIEPQALRVQSIKNTLAKSQALGFYDQEQVDTLNAGANINNAIHDAGKSAESAKEVMRVVSDENFNGKTYDLTAGERKSVYAQAKNLHDMMVVGDEFDSLSKDDEFAHRVGLISASDLPQATKSTQIYDLGIMMGISGPNQDMAQAQLAMDIGITPTGTKENANTLFMKIERMKLEKPQTSEEAMAFIKRQRETLDEITSQRSTGGIGNKEFLNLTKKFNKDLVDAKALAMGQVQEKDDVPWDMPFLGEDYSGGYSYEDAYKEFSDKISNTSLRADYFNEYTRIVEQMEDTGEVPTYVDKDLDKWGRRKAVRNQLVSTDSANKPKRAQQTLDSAKRSVFGSGTEEMLSSDKYGFGLRHDKQAYKGMGYLGGLRDTENTYMTEYSVGVSMDGEEVEIPSIVPTLTKNELKTIVNDKKVTPEITQKAVDFAKQRKSEGKSVWASKGDRKKYILETVNSSEVELAELMEQHNTRTEDEVLNALMKEYLKG